MICMFKFITSAFKSKDKKKFVFTIDGHKYILMKTTPEDYMYSGIRSEYKVIEILPTPMMIELDENGKFISVK